MGNNRQIDKAKEQKAWTAATLRLVVAGYIAYLGYKIVSAEDTTMSHTVALIFGIVFWAAAAGILGYIIYRLRIDLAAARITGGAPAQTAEQLPQEDAADGADGDMS